MVGWLRRLYRDAAVALVVAAAVVVVFCFGGGGNEVGRGGVVNVVPVMSIPQTPVVRPAQANVWRAVRRARMADVGNAGGTGAEGAAVTPAGDVESDRVREERHAAEQERRREALREAERLRQYAALLPERDAETFTYLVSELERVSAQDPDWGGAEEREGQFFNSAFYSGGLRGRHPEFQRAWVYLLRAIGVEMEGQSAQEVVELAERLFYEGLEEIIAIEMEIFGARLEGGAARDWAGGFPPMDDCIVVWDMRNTVCVPLYEEFVGGLGAMLSEDARELLAAFLSLFNLSA